MGIMETVNKRRNSSGSVSGGYVTVQFDKDTSQEDFLAYADAQKWWGYHPAGYGGTWRMERPNVWVYTFRVTGD